jgi:multidrug efflux system membrane fusion protein
VINQLIPVYVNFTVPQQTLPDVKRYMAQHPLTVEASIPSDSGPVERGTLTFIDNFVDSTTGTIHLKATFENPQNRLWPGLFVNTLMTLSEQPNAVTVPSQAVTSGQNNTQMVYVVKENNTVDARTVVSTRTIGPDAIIDSGLTPGETVVVDGQLRLVPGSRVQARNQPDDPPQGGGQQEQGARSKKGIDPPGTPDDPSGNSPARGAGKGGEEQPGSKS